MSAFGTKQTKIDVRFSAAVEGIAEMRRLD
jgi:hypothetical protein